MIDNEISAVKKKPSTLNQNSRKSHEGNSRISKIQTFNLKRESLSILLIEGYLKNLLLQGLPLRVQPKEHSEVTAAMVQEPLATAPTGDIFVMLSLQIFRMQEL